MDSVIGKVLATAPIGDGVDGAAFDPGTQLAFASCGQSATVTIAHEEARQTHCRPGFENRTWCADDGAGSNDTPDLPAHRQIWPHAGIGQWRTPPSAHNSRDIQNFGLRNGQMIPCFPRGVLKRTAKATTAAAPRGNQGYGFFRDPGGSVARSSSAIKPSVVCSFASSAGSNFKARMALLVSGPMDASLICGNFFSILGKSKRAWKCSTVEPLVKVIQSAPSFQQAFARAGQILRFGDGLVNRRCRPRWRRVPQRVAAGRSSPPRRAAGTFSGFHALIFREGLGDLCAGAFVRRQIHLQMQFPQFGRRGRADRGDPRAADVAQVLESFEKKSKNAVTPFALVNTSQS